MSQPGDLQLHHLRQEIKRQVDFPEELALSVREDAGRVLLDEIAACQTEADLLKLAYSLARRRLNDLFGAVLVISAAEGEELFNRLLTIFQLRSSISLCQVAWAFYQHHYPNDRLVKVLAILIENLKEKDKQLFFITELSQAHLDARLPEELAKRAANLQAETKDEASQLPEEQLREKYPLLSAYTSLTLLPSEQMTSDNINSSLCGYMVRLAILPDSPFAAAFLTAWFDKVSDKDIQENSSLFIQAMRIGLRPAKRKLLSRYLQDYRFSEKWQDINYALLELFGIPELDDTDLPPEKEEEPALPPPAAQPKPVQDNFEPLPVIEVQAPAPAAEEQAAGQGLLGRFFGRKKKDQPDLDEHGPPVQASFVQPEIKPAGLPDPVIPEVKDQPAKEQPEEEIINQLQQKILESQQPAAETDLPEDGDIWQQIDPVAAARFRQWALLSQIQQHSINNERQMLFLSRYATRISSVEKWDERSLVLDMKGFYLVANRDTPECLWYYDNNTLELLRENQFSQPRLGPEGPEQLTSKDVLLNETPGNIVVIPLDSLNLLYAHDFMKETIDRLNQKA